MTATLVESRPVARMDRARRVFLLDRAACRVWWFARRGAAMDGAPLAFAADVLGRAADRVAAGDPRETTR